MNTIKNFIAKWLKNKEIAKWLKNKEISNLMIPTGCVPQLQMVRVGA